MKRKQLIIICLFFLCLNTVSSWSQKNHTTINTENTASVIIGGIEILNLNANKNIIRSMIYKSLINSQKYVVNDRDDVSEMVSLKKLDSCMGKQCLKNLAQLIRADFAVAARYEGLGDRILITLKMVDATNGEIVRNEMEQFENQPRELNRMTEIMINKLLKIPNESSASKMLIYKENMAASAGLGKLNNSGPRMGVAVTTGPNGAFFTRKERDGGLESIPVLFNIGYQLEKQYVGSENFSALFEFIGNVAGLEHGTPIPSFALLHGLRFGKGAWELAMGPSVSMKKLVRGTVGYDGVFRTYATLSQMGVQQPEQYDYYFRPDNRGATYFSANFVVGIGKTFRPGALNVPLNFYASFNKYGTTYGLSLGINITRSRKYTSTRLDR